MSLEITAQTPEAIVLGESLMGRADYLRIGGIVARGLGASASMDWLPPDTKDNRTGLLQTQSHGALAHLAVMATRYIENRTGNSVFDHANTGVVLQFGDVSLAQPTPTAIYTATIQPKHVGITLNCQRFSVDRNGHISRQPAPEYSDAARLETFQLLDAIRRYHLDRQTVAQLRGFREGQIRLDIEEQRNRAMAAESPPKRLRFWPGRR